MQSNQPAVEPIFILAGQSNMAGRCDAAEIPERVKPKANGVDF